MLDTGQDFHDTHVPLAGVESSPRITSAPIPGAYAPEGNSLARDQWNSDTQPARVPGLILPSTIAAAISIEVASAATISDPGQVCDDTHQGVAGADLAGSQEAFDTQAAHASGADALLSLLAEALDDLERVRIATENRLRSLEQIHGLAGTSFTASLQAMLAVFKRAERRATRDLERGMAAHQLAAYVGAHKGIGPKGIARLLAAIGDPAERPNPAKLWQYCGHGDPARSSRRKGEQTAYSPTAKTRLWQVAESASRQGHYRAVYLAARETAEGKVHTVECRNHVRPPGKSNGCGTVAHPEWGEIGSPWRDGHKHAHALRIVGKTILLDMWKASRT